MNDYNRKGETSPRPPISFLWFRKWKEKIEIGKVGLDETIKAFK